MDELRSKSYNEDPRGQVEKYSYATDGGNGYRYKEGSLNPNGLGDLRCYSASYAANNNTHKEVKFNKGKSVSKSWSFNDPELQRKKRVASYKVYLVEGKVKGSVKKSFRWIKDSCTKLVYGWR
ncbi:hypothetical protein BC332_18890 [Capsicum chinense]|nr:hypothetical protein BC332_18890 [Capsicum chinense]